MTESYPQVLSTQFTFFFKFVFPVVVLAALLSAMMLYSRVYPRGALGWLVPIGLVVALFWFYAWPIKRVVAYDRYLVASNYLREVRIPYDEIADVREVRWINWRPVVITLKTPSPFGDTIMFYPVVDRIFGGFDEERAATQLLRRHVNRK